MIKLIDMCDPLRQFEKIEDDLPFVILNENNDLQKQLGFFLNICIEHLKDCTTVEAVFPMFYQLTNWNPFSTELINPLSYLSSYPDSEFELILSKQLAISNLCEKFSFTRQLLEIQNDLQNKKRFNIIISHGNRDSFSIVKCNLKFCFSSLLNNGNNLKKNKLEVINRDPGKKTDSEISFTQLELPESIKEDVLKKMYVPSYIHTIYLKKDYKIYYIFSNCVSEFETNSCNLKSTYGLGGIFVLMKDIYSQEKEDKFIKILERITDKVANRIVNYFQLTLVQKHATRAAISQVMARNTSHNIGAHVMNKLIDGIENIDINNFTNYKPCTDILSEDDQNKFKQIAFFNSYLKCRMDYLSDISFGTPLMQTNKYAFNELFKEFDKVRLLLEHISGLSDFNYTIKFKKNGEDFTTEEDLLVAIPNDILGTQAFYNILENIIRNTAKYSDKSKVEDENVVFTINFINRAAKDSPTEINKILIDYIAVEVYDNVSVVNIEDLVKKQNNNLNDDILSDNKLRSSSLGLVEMGASAAYLRKREVGLINDSKYNIMHDNSWQSYDGHKYFLKAFNKVEGQHNYLAYRFFLLCPAVVLVITNEKCNNIDELKKQGIWIVTTENFEKHLSSCKVYNHEFVVFDKDCENKIKESINNNKTSLPIRILKIEQSELKELLNTNCKNKILDIWEKFCWETWEKELKNIYSKDYVYIITSVDLESLKITSKKYYAIFLDHNKYWTDYESSTKIDYLDALSTKAFQKLPKYPQYKNNISKFFGTLYQNELQRNKIIESVLSKTLIIDERIQCQIENTVTHQKKGIISPITYVKSPFFVFNEKEIKESKFNLSAKTFCEDYCNALKKYVCYYNKIFKKPDFIVIHYSILERIFNDNENKINAINIFLDNLIYENSPQIIITSGRGTLKNLSHKVRFVNLSPLITSFVEIQSKYYGNYLLHSSRKNNDI